LVLQSQLSGPLTAGGQQEGNGSTGTQNERPRRPHGLQSGTVLLSSATVEEEQRCDSDRSHDAD
ncbi:MAG TPA: hypothetical protein VJS67_08395, partial [Pseudonocardiaceae bacterium]|nr:hypothetical protein [Pseudonocardiaceae bacterium]